MTERSLTDGRLANSLEPARAPHEIHDKEAEGETEQFLVSLQTERAEDAEEEPSWLSEASDELHNTPSEQVAPRAPTPRQATIENDDARDEEIDAMSKHAQRDHQFVLSLPTALQPIAEKIQLELYKAKVYGCVALFLHAGFTHLVAALAIVADWIDAP